MYGVNILFSESSRPYIFDNTVFGSDNLPVLEIWTAGKNNDSITPVRILRSLLRHKAPIVCAYRRSAHRDLWCLLCSLSSPALLHVGKGKRRDG